MPVENQVALIWCVTLGYIDDLPVELVADFEEQFMEFLNNSNKNLLDEIANKQVLSDDIVEKLKSVCESFVATFKSTIIKK